jgi:hypothetical protein
MYHFEYLKGENVKIMSDFALQSEYLAFFD